MVGDKYILEPEAILDHSVQAEGKRWYLVKWKPKWVKKHELPEGVYEKWEAKKAKRAKMDPEDPEPEEEEEEEGFRILEERRVVPGEEPPEDEEADEEDEMNGEDEEGDEDEEEEEEEGEEGEEEEEDIGLDENIEIKEEEEDGDYSHANGELDNDELNTLSSIDRDIVLNGLPGDIDLKEEDEIKEEEDKISIPTDYSKPYS